MSRSIQSIARALLGACSKFLFALGALTFLLGDKFLSEIDKLSFLPAAVIGISSGLLLMGLGYAAGLAEKRLINH